MSEVSLSGNDTVIIAGRNLTSLADDDHTVLDYPNELAAVKTGKNGNTLYANNETGRQVTVTIRVIAGSTDDKFLNSLMRQQLNNFAGFVLMPGQFVKRVGNGLGFINSITYPMDGGVFTKSVNAKSNSSGDTEQSVAVYVIQFGNSLRSIL